MSAPIAYELRPNAGQQMKALKNPAFELLFGGGAGGGKSFALFYGWLYYINFPRARGIFFRTTFQEVLKLSADEAAPMFEPLGAKLTGGNAPYWLFPSGARLYLSYLRTAKDAFRHQGAAYQYVAFDELTHYPEFAYTYLISRIRSKDDRIPLAVRASCNPEPGWVRDRWKPWVHPEDGPRAEDGQILWTKKNEEGIEGYVKPGTDGATTRTFVRSLLADNPAFSGVSRANYAAQLLSLDPVQRDRLLRGDWGADYAPGLLFRRGMFKPMAPEAVPHAAIRCRAWDLAATEEKLVGPNAYKPQAKNDPDWTVGLLYGWHPDIGFFIEHVERVRGRPEVARATIERISKQDAAKYGANNVAISFPQDPGAAGKTVAAGYASLLAGYPLEIVTPSGSKTLRAGPASSTAENLGIGLVRGPWNELFLQEAEQFPKGPHDDQIDALSDAHALVATLRGKYEEMRKRQQHLASSGIADLLSGGYFAG